jgi:hypothetical protein
MIWKLIAKALCANNTWLGLKLFSLAKKTPYYHLIDYMDRYWLFQTPWLSARFHVIKRPDSCRYLHDHPFWFRSIILQGRYAEQVLGQEWLNFYWPGDVNRVDADLYHRIHAIGGDSVLTLVFIGPKLPKSWGFLVKGKHVHHSDYKGDV